MKMFGDFVFFNAVFDVPTLQGCCLLPWSWNLTQVSISSETIHSQIGFFFFFWVINWNQLCFYDTQGSETPQSVDGPKDDDA